MTSKWLLSLSYLKKDLHYRNQSKPNQRPTNQIIFLFPFSFPCSEKWVALCKWGQPGLESCVFVMRKTFHMFFHILPCLQCLAVFLQIMKMPWFVLQEQRFCHSKAKMHPATCPLILLCSTLCPHQLLLFRSDDTSSLDPFLVLWCCCYKE